ncbi:hypothetical protein HMPREF9135_0496 [Segatella baroniae F0067]|uniref:Uncharacterized protein n=1 Tax=Segatella baroniae F0067 TaxID=1115809 RepID=U2P8Y0_9BACT|nr:hypothetical protein HMPREF9135_0496 [Segatella baroniae F0067]
MDFLKAALWAAESSAFSRSKQCFQRAEAALLAAEGSAFEKRVACGRNQPRRRRRPKAVPPITICP